MSFVSDDRGFALATIACGARRCAALFGTADGGATWRRLTAPTRAIGSTYSTCPGASPCSGQIRFATPLIGYAFAPSLLMTTDGGRHWRHLAAAAVSSLEAADGTVVRVDSGTDGCTGRPALVQAARVGGASWRDLPAPPIEMICPPVLYRQGERLVLAGYGNAAGGVRATARIDRSADGGGSWTGGPDRCGGHDGYAATVALAPPSTLVLLCQHQMARSDGTFGPAWVRVSTDDGATFGPDERVPAARGTFKGEVASYQLAAATAGRLLILQGGTHGWRALLTQDGGRSWSVPLRPDAFGNPLLVGFEDPLTARVAQAGTVWTTRDGGRHWHASTIKAGA